MILTSGQPSSLEPYRDKGHWLSKGKAPQWMVCFLWNQGEHAYRFCNFRHACMQCGGDHLIIHCRSLGVPVTPPDHKFAQNRGERVGRRIGPVFPVKIYLSDTRETFTVREQYIPACGRLTNIRTNTCYLNRFQLKLRTGLQIFTIYY